MEKKICVYAIAKNEIKFVQRWFDSVKEADYVCVLDTGSDDGTLSCDKSAQTEATLLPDETNDEEDDINFEQYVTVAAEVAQMIVGHNGKFGIFLFFTTQKFNVCYSDSGTIRPRDVSSPTFYAMIS